MLGVMNRGKLEIDSGVLDSFTRILMTAATNTKVMTKMREAVMMGVINLDHPKQH